MEPDTGSIHGKSCVHHAHSSHRELEFLATKLDNGGVRAILEAEDSRAIGDFWLQLRRESGIARSDVAETVDVRTEQLRSFERGLLSFKDIRPDFLPRLAIALGGIELFDRFIEELGTRAFEFEDIRDRKL